MSENSYWLSPYEVPGFPGGFRNRGNDPVKYEATDKANGDVDVTFAFSAFVGGERLFNAGEKTTLPVKKFRILAYSGGVREVLRDEHLKLIDDYVAKKGLVKEKKADKVETTKTHTHKHKTKSKKDNKSNDPIA